MYTIQVFLTSLILEVHHLDMIRIVGIDIARPVLQAYIWIDEDSVA